MESGIPLSKLIQELHARPSIDEPYPKAASSIEPLKFYEAEKGLEILIIQAKKEHGRISRKLYNEVLAELKKISEDPKFLKNIQLVFQELVSHFQKAATVENNTVLVDVTKMQAILDVLQRA